MTTQDAVRKYLEDNGWERAGIDYYNPPDGPRYKHKNARHEVELHSDCIKIIYFQTIGGHSYNLETGQIMYGHADDVFAKIDKLMKKPAKTDKTEEEEDQWV